MSSGGIGGQEVPVSFASCYLTTSKCKGLAIVAQASITNWTLQRCKRFLSFATRIEVIVLSADYVVIMREISEHLRLQALMVDMLLINPEWVVGTNPWVDPTVAPASLIQDREGAS